MGWEYPAAFQETQCSMQNAKWTLLTSREKQHPRPSTRSFNLLLQLEEVYQYWLMGLWPASESNCSPNRVDLDVTRIIVPARHLQRIVPLG